MFVIDWQMIYQKEIEMNEKKYIIIIDHLKLHLFDKFSSSKPVVILLPITIRYFIDW